MENKKENKNYYLLLFMPPKCPPEEFKEDLAILKTVLKMVSPNYSALVGFEQGKNRVLAVHVILKNINIDRFVIQKDFFIAEYEYIRFWYERKSALKVIAETDLAKVEEYVRTVCAQVETWGNGNGNVSSQGP